MEIPTNDRMAEPLGTASGRANRTVPVLLGGLIAPLVLFGSIAEEIAEQEKLAFDHEGLMLVHGYSSVVMNKVMALFTHAGSGPGLTVLCAIAVGILLCRRKRAAALFLAISLTGSAVLNPVLKAAFARTRPDLWVSALPETSFSFPSGHAMNTMTLCAALVVVAWPGKWRVAVLSCSMIFVFLVSLSRLYWGVHYPTDIFAGWAFAIAWVCAIKYVFDGYWRLASRRY